MWYTVAFIAGSLIGVIAMALFTASNMDQLERRNRDLAGSVNEKSRELRHYQDLMESGELSQKDLDELSETADLAG